VQLFFIHSCCPLLPFPFPFCYTVSSGVPAPPKYGAEGGAFVWGYHSPIGDLIIKLWENGKYVLLYGAECYGFWSTPRAAADDDFTHTTGCPDWDLLDCQIDDVPAELSDWKKV